MQIISEGAKTKSTGPWRGDDGWGASTSNGYDDWGRLTTSARGGVTARYAWRYGSKLYSVDLNNDGTPEVTYKTGGDGKRRARIAGASETWYNWDSGFTVISEETGSTGTGALMRTYVGRSLAHLDGSNPATGTWRYMYHDHLGGVRQVRDANRNLVAEYAFLPYGQMDAWSGTANATTRLFTGHDRDPLTGQDYAPYRWYSSTMNRWLSRDPLGMVDGPNVYAYVGGNPASMNDLMGLSKKNKECIEAISKLIDKLRDANKCNDDCKIPDDIRGELVWGSWIFPYSYSPAKGVIRMNKIVCGHELYYQRHILHEVSHASRDFSRFYYVIDKIRHPKGGKDSFWKKEEKTAEDFSMKCNVLESAE